MNIFRDISLFSVSTYNTLKIRQKSENGQNELPSTSIDTELNGEQFRVTRPLRCKYVDDVHIFSIFVDFWVLGLCGIQTFALCN